MANVDGRLLCRRGCFPNHKLVQRLASSIDHELDDGCIVYETEKRRLVRDQIEWIDQIIESGDNPQERVIRNLAVFAAMVRANQTQHGLKIRPAFLKRLPRNRRRLFGCFVEK